MWTHRTACFCHPAVHHGVHPRGGGPSPCVYDLCVWPRRYFTRSVVLRPPLRRLDLLTRVLWQMLLLRLQQTRPPSMPREYQPLLRMFPFGMCQSSKANETSHRCPSSIKCPDCHRWFHGHQCLNNHQRFTLMGQTATQDKL